MIGYRVQKVANRSPEQPSKVSRAEHGDVFRLRCHLAPVDGFEIIDPRQVRGPFQIGVPSGATGSTSPSGNRPNKSNDRR
jgi:hypothetical protein